MWAQIEVFPTVGAFIISHCLKGVSSSFTLSFRWSINRFSSCTWQPVFINPVRTPYLWDFYPISNLIKISDGTQRLLQAKCKSQHTDRITTKASFPQETMLKRDSTWAEILENTIKILGSVSLLRHGTLWMKAHMKSHMCIYTHVFIYTFKYTYASVCVHCRYLYTFPFFSTEQEPSLEYNLRILLGTLHSYERKQITLYSINSKVKYSCALFFSNILSRESPMRRDECIKKKPFAYIQYIRWYSKTKPWRLLLVKALTGVRRSFDRATTQQLGSKEVICSVLLVFLDHLTTLSKWR